MQKTTWVVMIIIHFDTEGECSEDGKSRSTKATLQVGYYRIEQDSLSDCSCVVVVGEM